MKENKKMLVNLIATIIAFLVNAGINFVLSSYIVNTVSEEAYGFIQLANTFITYFTVITIAINSMASRFISIEYYKGNKKDANEYYASTFFANLFIMLVTLPIIILAIFNLEKIVEISPSLIIDVKMLLIFLAGNLYLGLLTTNLSVAYYIKNKLYIQSIINTIAYILKAVLLVVLYKLFPPYIAFFGLVTLLITTFLQCLSIYYKNKLIPEIKINKSKINIKKIKIIVLSGIWNSVTRIGNILSEGLDLLLTNVYIGTTEMGVLAIVKTMPSMIGSVLNNIVNIFIPKMTELYAQEKKEEFVHEVKKAMTVVGSFLNIPIICIIVLGDVLFRLWFPAQDPILLQVLSVITVAQWVVVGPVSIMHNIFTIINKIKVNSILVCITGAVNVLIVYILLNTTSLGLYAVTGVSCLLSIIRNLMYTLPYGAKYIGAKWTKFFPEIIKYIISVCIVCAIGYGIRFLINPTTWIQLIVTGIILCILALVINVIIMISKKDKKHIFNIIKRKLRRI